MYFLSYTFRENFSFLMLQFSIFILHLYILMTWIKEQLNGREKIHFFFFLVEGGKSLFYPSFLDINVWDSVHCSWNLLRLFGECNVNTAVVRNGDVAGAALKHCPLPPAPSPGGQGGVSVVRRGAHVAWRALTDDSSFLPSSRRSYPGTVRLTPVLFFSLSRSGLLPVHGHALSRLH